MKREEVVDMWWRGRSLRILVIFKQTLEVNRIPPVRITGFHHHNVYLSGGELFIPPQKS